MPSRKRAFSLIELLIVIGTMGILFTSLAVIENQARSARLAARSRIEGIEAIGSAARAICEDVRRASGVLASYGSFQAGNDTLILRSDGEVLIYRCGASGLTRERSGEKGIKGRRTLLPPGTAVAFAFPGEESQPRWVEITLLAQRDRKLGAPPYRLFAGLR